MSPNTYPRIHTTSISETGPGKSRNEELSAPKGGCLIHQFALPGLILSSDSINNVRSHLLPRSHLDLPSSDSVQLTQLTWTTLDTRDSERSQVVEADYGD